jgi:putative ABC transport system substrate-binding protein
MTDLAREERGRLLVLPDIFNGVHGRAIVGLAARHRFPAVYPFPTLAAAGGLMSYSIDQIDQYRHLASYVDRILKGAKPSDLPVQNPTKFELVINLKTAKALGITVAPSLLGVADRVIE